ncbi:MAG: sensor histidine kinase [Pseudonocardia sp.]
MAGFVVLLAVSGLVAGFVVREVLLLRLEDRIESSLGQEVSEFSRFLLRGEPAARARLDVAFDSYLASNVPSNEEGFVAFVDGTLHRSAVNRFPLDRLPAEILARFAVDGSGVPAGPEDVPSGRFDTEIGTGYYRSLPVQVGAQTGTFVVMLLPTAELAEIAELQRYGALTVLSVVAAAAAVAWVFVRRLLRPVEALTEAAEQISRSDLTRRVEVSGQGEAADMARTFNAMLDRLSSVFRAEREFVRDASHELRVPLTVCMGNLDVLAIGLPASDTERAATVALVNDEIARMARIVDDLRLLADAGQGDFAQAERIDLATLHEDLIAKTRVLGPREWLREGEATGTMTADRHRIIQAVMNLADNAVRHTTDCDVIAIGLDATADEVWLWVRDTGVGVQPADQARIFERFSRGASAYRRYRGSGLGLSIVKAIAEAHGGRVEISSIPGEGARFTMVLPRRPGPATPRP